MRGDKSIAPFADGLEIRAFTKLGCHKTADGYVFRVWAPEANAAFVTGDFNGWSEGTPMVKVDPAGLWEGFVPAENITVGSLYKYKFINGEKEIYKADPFAPFAGGYPESASRVFSHGGYGWRDGQWLSERKKKYSQDGARKLPINIYELHLPSWKRSKNGGYISYDSLSDDLAPYLLQMGYTHIELIDPFEEAEDGKSSFYAMSARLGDPVAFKSFVDSMHRAGIGVILDWNISRFSICEHGLSSFDGGCTYEKQGNEEKGRFDMSLGSVQSFIISNAVYLAEIYHIDGLRIESLASCLYDDRGIPVRSAVSLIRRLNGVMRDYFPDVMMIADDLFGSSAVTSNASGGLGFTFKWDSVCTRDTLAYAQVGLEERARHTGELSAPLKHAFGEASVLTLAHSDVTNGRESFINKMPGTYNEKFAGNRVFFTYMMTRPGKKLRFMGSEIGQFDEWDENGEIQWFLLDYRNHAAIQLYLAELGRIYLETPALWELDCTPRGFSLDSAQGGVFAYRRFDSEGGEVAVALNFTPYRICKYSIGVSHSGTWEELISSDSTRFGGSGVENGSVEAVLSRYQALPYSLTVDLPPLGAVVLKYIK